MTMAKQNKTPLLPESDMERALLKQLERLEDPKCNIEEETKRAKAMIGVGTVLVNSARTKIDLLRMTNGMARKEGRPPKELPPAK